MIQQQNILDAFSRRSELQLALAASVAAGKINIKNATSYARQLDLDLQTVGLNRTAVAFGAGESTFGWMFYPRVQTPPSQSNPRRIGGLLYWNGTSPDYDVKNRQIEPGPRECIALIVVPNFVPTIGLTTVANWFDVTYDHGHRKLNNREMLEMSHKVQKARAALSRICDGREYRPNDLTILQQRVSQLSNLLPTQDLQVDLPDEGDLLGSEIFSENAAGLGPTLLSWYGEHPQEGQNSSIFLLGRGLNVTETQVIAGGVDVPDAQKRLISRNVMEIVIPANARIYKHHCLVEADGQDGATGGAKAEAPNPDYTKPWNPDVTGLFDPSKDRNPDPSKPLTNPNPTLPLNPDPTLPLNPDPSRPLNPIGAFFDRRMPHNPAPNLRPNPDPNLPANPDPARAPYPDPKKKPTPKPCGWAVIDVHVATPNGISNHLLVEADPKPSPPAAKNIVMMATTTTTADPRRNQTTTSTRVETTPPGMALPPLTVLPLGTQMPANSVLVQGSVTGAPAGSIFPGMVNTPAPAAPIPPPTLDTTAPVTGSVPSTPAPVAPAAPSVSPENIPSPPPSAPMPPGPLAPAGTPAYPPTSSLIAPPSALQASIAMPGGSSRGDRDERLVQSTSAPGEHFQLPPLPPPARTSAIVPTGGEVRPGPASVRRPAIPMPNMSFRSSARRPNGEPTTPGSSTTTRPAAVAPKPDPKEPPAKRSLLGRMGLSDR